MDRPDLAHLVLELGFITCLEQVIEKGITQIQFEQSKTKNQKQIDLCLLAIEQAYLSLTEVSHFLEAGDILKGITKSQLVAKSLRLVLNGPSFASVVNSKIFRQCSTFLKELTNDNPYASSLFSAELDSFMLGTSPTSISPTADNIDFYWNLLELHFNIVFQREGSAGV